MAKHAEHTKASLGQKIMLDFRYFCKESTQHCRTPMETLPDELAQLIKRHDIGGVILFSENVQNISKTVALTQSLQKAAGPSPLFISIDQEGGRVARINRAVATSFTGNMSIGATFETHGTHYASAIANAIGKELNSLGINVNFAPSVDVNSNPLNPVINVRSFSEHPKTVSILGAAQVKGFEEQGVIAAIKHFPGHGDTHVDSHTGLPLVEHNEAKIWQQDLLPFKEIIDQQSPGMIMTAHIQYPALDNTQLINKHGKTMTKPATMSKVIMTDLLREKLGYKGVTITDALDMAGISDFFSPFDAVLETFNAGVDIALMPLAIRTPEDIKHFDRFMQQLNDAYNTNQIDQSLTAQSLKRIQTLKQTMLMDVATPSLAQANSILGNPQHRKLEAELALSAITQVKNKRVLPIQDNTTTKLHIIMPDNQKCLALMQAINKESTYLQTTTCNSLQGFDLVQAKKDIEAADIIIAAHASPQQNAAEIGGMEDISVIKDHAIKRADQPKLLKQLLEFAHKRQKKTVFVSLRTPYEISDYYSYSDAVLATYAYNVDVNTDNNVSGPAFTALAKILLGKATAKGNLPVSI